MNPSNSFRLADSRDSISPAESPQQTASQAGVDAAELTTDAGSSRTAEVVLDDVVGEIAEQFRLHEILEEACVATGATGAAIALARGEELLCRATAGSDAPDLGVSIDPNRGLSGSCIQTRQLQHCPDTETNPLVDSVACQQLGVRSIAVLPLMRGNELLGIFEILSSRPNAFGDEELDRMQALSRQILQRKREEGESQAGLPPPGERSSHKPRRAGVRDQVLTAPSTAGISPRTPAARRRDIRSLILGVLVIHAAILLGLVLGLRIGWERATLQIRNHPLPRQVSAPSGTGGPKETFLPMIEGEPNSAPVGARDHFAGRKTQKFTGATKSSPDPGSSGLTIRQDGKVVFVAPPSSSTDAKESQ
jgi:putative methionine-R-sulfoxide reductase with GAF domain